MTITTDAIANVAAKCNFNTTYSTTLSQLPSFTAIRSCVIDYIVESNSLTPAEKLYYLVNDFYIQSFKSWIRNSSKSLSTKSYSPNEVKFAASKIGDLLGLSKKKIFNIQKKLESLGYLQINRSINQYGMNNVNVSVVTLPKNIFSYLIYKADNKSFSDAVEVFDIPADRRKEIITKAKQFIPMNFDLFRFVFFHKHLSCSSKLLYIKLFSIIHKIKKKYKYPIYACGLDNNTIIKNCNISRTTLFRSIKQLQENGLIKCEKIRTESEDKSSNRFDKIINYIQILVPKELEHILVNNTVHINSNAADSNKETSAQAAENIFEKETSVSKVPPVCTKSTYLINKNKKNIKELDKEKIDKKEINDEINELIEISKSISNFLKFSFSSKEEEARDKSPALEQNKIFEKKSLSDFYPLSSEDCVELSRKSGRGFSINAMNEILKSLTNKLINPMFYSKKSFMAYMTKVFKHEMRKPSEINGETFRISINMNEGERKTYEIEKYLSKIENTPLEIVTPEWHLKKKLASVLTPITAYNVLINYRGITMVESATKSKSGITIIARIAQFKLQEYIELADMEKEIISEQVRATHEKINEDCDLLWIEDVEFVMPPKRKTEDKTQKPEIVPRTGIWGDIRTTMAGYSSNGDATDASWFSKLEAEIDEETKRITLKAPKEFMRDWIYENYKSTIDEASKYHGYIYHGIYAEGNPKVIR